MSIVDKKNLLDFLKKIKYTSILIREGFFKNQNIVTITILEENFGEYEKEFYLLENINYKELF